MKRLVCWVVGHKPYIAWVRAPLGIEGSNEVWCRRCGRSLGYTDEGEPEGYR